MAGMVIGSGIFRVPSVVAAEAGSAPIVLAIWALGGIISLCGALALAELATMFPRAGGQYVFLREAYGRPVAFLFGWTYMLFTPAAWAAIALIFASYMGHFLPLGADGVRAVAASLIAVLAAAHYRSVRLGAWIQNLSTGAKVLALVGLAMVIFVFGTPGDGSFAQSPARAASTARLGIALIGVLFAYEGWAAFTALAGEVRKPNSSIPRALIGGMSLVVVVYLLVNAAYLFALPMHAIAASPLVAADAVTRAAGAGGAALVAALVALSTFGALNATVMSDPRVFFAMASDRLFFRPLASVHPRHSTPHISIVFTSGLAILYVSVRTFEQLAEAFIVGIWPFFALLVLGVVVLRRRLPNHPRPYRTFGYPVTPLLFLIASFLLIGNALVEHPRTTLLSFAVTLAGIPIYFFWRRRASSGEA